MYSSNSCWFDTDTGVLNGWFDILLTALITSRMCIAASSMVSNGIGDYLWQVYYHSIFQTTRAPQTGYPFLGRRNNVELCAVCALFEHCGNFLAS